jgi:hypothetical protein
VGKAFEDVSGWAGVAFGDEGLGSFVLGGSDFLLEVDLVQLI